MQNELIEIVATNGVRVIIMILATIVTAYVIPWLKEKRLYSTVQRLVEAAEKLKENAPAEFDKHDYVVSALEAKGVKISPFVSALIEAAVIQLDIEMEKGKITE